MGDPIDNVVPFPSRPAPPARDLAPLRAALRELRLEIDARFPAQQPAAPRAAIDWAELLDELRHRLGQIGVAERSSEVDAFGLDPMTLARSRGLLDFLVDRYWRVDLCGADRLPHHAPVLFVANHAGLLPWDGLVFAHLLQRARPEWPRTRFLVADWLVTLPFAQPLLAQVGGVRACRENADRLLRQEKPVLAFPEGEKGAAKDFRSRYQLQRFGRGGVIRAAIECGVPLVPVGIVGAEETHPVLFKSTLAGRALGLPFIPVTPSFPVLGPLGAIPLPSKWRIEIGEPLDLGDFAPGAAEDGPTVSRLNEELRAQVRALVARGLAGRRSVWV